jgi:hypothetical protein
MSNRYGRGVGAILLASLFAIFPGTSPGSSKTLANEYEFNDEHIHLTNYVQKARRSENLMW